MQTGVELNPLTAGAQHHHHVNFHQQGGWSSYFNLCAGVFHCSEKTKQKLTVGTCLSLGLCLIIGLSVGLTWADGELDKQCNAYSIKNDSGSTMYFDPATFGPVFDGYSFQVDIPVNTTVSYPFSWYNRNLVKENCVFKVRPKNSKNGEPPVEVTGCSPTPNAFDSGVCLYDIKDKSDRRLKGLPEVEEGPYINIDNITSVQQFSFFTSEPAAAATSYFEDVVSHTM